MKKKLFTLLLCVFAVLGANAASTTTDDEGYLVISTGSTGEINNGFLNSHKNQIRNAQKVKLSGSFSSTDLSSLAGYLDNIQDLNLSGATIATIPQSFLADKTTLSSLTLGANITEIGNGAFMGCTNLSNVDFTNATSLETIGENAFIRTGITTLTVPTSVKTIEQNAFGECRSLTTVTIPEDSELEVIKSQAFNNCMAITDVYINAIPRAGSGTDNTFGNIDYFPWCEANAFPYDIMVNQTAIDGSDENGNSMATLHFNEDYFDFFCGDWKKGLAFTQKNLNSIKDGYEDENGTRLGPNNGWQQFAMTGSPTEQIVPQGKFVRTFSSNTAYVIPVYRWEDTSVPVEDPNRWKSGDIFKCYRVTDYDYKDGSNSSVTLTELQQVMPANTGMILRSVELNEEDALIFMLEATGDKYNLTQYPYGTGNLLETSIEPTEIGPVTLDSNNKVAFRNFGLYEVAEDTYQFKRYKKGTIRANRAYLKLTANQFPNSNEGEFDGPGSGLDDGTGDAKIFLMFEDLEEPASETTGISIVDIKKNDNTYYNLQGMKVENPSKGIYIYNGKKIIK